MSAYKRSVTNNEYKPVLKYLFRHLSEVMNERDDSVPLHGVRDLVNVHCSLVEEMVEDVVTQHGVLPSLLEPEDQVNPLVEVCRDIVTLQCLMICRREGGKR